MEKEIIITENGRAEFAIIESVERPVDDNIISIEEQVKDIKNTLDVLLLKQEGLI